MVGTYDAGREIELQVQIGSKMYPEMPVRSTANAFSQLIKCLGIQSSPFHSLDIDLASLMFCVYFFPVRAEAQGSLCPVGLRP